MANYKTASHALFFDVKRVAESRGWLLVRGPPCCGKRFIIEATLRKLGYTIELVTDDGDECYKTALINDVRSRLTVGRGRQKRAVLLTYASEIGPTELKRLVESTRSCALFMTDTDRYTPALECLRASQFFLPQRPDAPVLAAPAAIDNIFDLVNLLKCGRRYFAAEDSTRYLEHVSVVNLLVAETLSAGDTVKYAGLLTLDEYVTHTLPMGAITETPEYSVATRAGSIDVEGRLAKIRASHPTKSRLEILDASSLDLVTPVVIAPRSQTGAVLSDKKRRALENVANYRNLKRPRIDAAPARVVEWGSEWDSSLALLRGAWMQNQLFVWSDRLLPPDLGSDHGFRIRSQMLSKDETRVGVWIERV